MKRMEHNQDILYSVFKTRWGWFGLLGSEKGLLRSCLPVSFQEAAKQRLLTGIDGAIQDKKVFIPIEKRIKAYYKGQGVDFKRLVVCFDGLTDFQGNVLTTLRQITYGHTISYGDLANRSNCPRGARAIGTVMAKNPLPLIIPCHRVIKKDGSLGYFSAAGGVETKQRMLDLEKS